MVMFFPQLVRTNVADLLLAQMTIYKEKSYLDQILHRRESVIVKYSKHPHLCMTTHSPQSIRLIRAGAQPKQ